jgi:hypothetical protein
MTEFPRFQPQPEAEPFPLGQLDIMPGVPQGKSGQEGDLESGSQVAPDVTRAAAGGQERNEVPESVSGQEGDLDLIRSEHAAEQEEPGEHAAVSEADLAGSLHLGSDDEDIRADLEENDAAGDENENVDQEGDVLPDLISPAVADSPGGEQEDAVEATKDEMQSDEEEEAAAEAAEGDEEEAADHEVVDDAEEAQKETPEPEEAEDGGQLEDDWEDEGS